MATGTASDGTMKYEAISRHSSEHFGFKVILMILFLVWKTFAVCIDKNNLIVTVTN